VHDERGKNEVFEVVGRRYLWRLSFVKGRTRRIAEPFVAMSPIQAAAAVNGS